MIHIGIGEYIITDSTDETITTHALGSCVALILYCKKTKHTAMAHIALPKPSEETNLDYYKKKTGLFCI
jgi:chemotaxis protein CheD